MRGLLAKKRSAACDGIAGAALVAGWKAHDAAHVAVSPEPWLVLRLIPACSAIVVTGALVGAVCSQARGVLLWLLLLVSLAGS